MKSKQSTGKTQRKPAQLLNMINGARTICELGYIIRQYSTTFTALELSFAFNRWATLNDGKEPRRSLADNKEILELLETRSYAVRADDPRCFPFILWSLAKLRYPRDSQLVRHMSDRVTSMLGSLKPRYIAKILWAWATLMHRPSKEVLEAFEDQCAKCMSDFNPQDIGNTLWALATLNHRPSVAVMNSIDRRILDCISDFIPQTISNTLWALATLKYSPSSAILNSVDCRVLDCIKGFKPQTISNTLWAWAALNYRPSAAVTNSLDCRIFDCVRDFKPQDISNTLWAWAALGIRPSSAVLKSLESRISDCVNDFNPQTISNTLWACASLGYLPSRVLLEALDRRILESIDKFHRQDFSNTVWGLTLLGFIANRITTDGAGFCVLVGRLNQAHDESKLGNEKVYGAIYHAYYMSDGRIKYSASLLDHSWKMWKKQLSESSSTSSGERELGRILQSLGVPFEADVLLADGSHRVDILIDREETAKPLAIEFDGPLHFTRASDGTYRYNGMTIARNTAMTRLGLDVLCIPFYRWYDLSASDRVAYVTGELCRRGIQRVAKTERTL